MYKCVVLVSDTTIMHPIDKFLYMGKAIIGAMDNFQLLMDKTNRYAWFLESRIDILWVWPL